MGKEGNLFKAFLAGGAVGAVLGLLFAPDSGDRTRKRLAQLSESTIDSVETGKKDLVDRLQWLKQEINSLTNQAVESGQKRVHDELEAINAAFEKLREARSEQQAEGEEA